MPFCSISFSRGRTSWCESEASRALGQYDGITSTWRKCRQMPCRASRPCKAKYSFCRALPAAPKTDGTHPWEELSSSKFGIFLDSLRVQVVSCRVLGRTAQHEQWAGRRVYVSPTATGSPTQFHAPMQPIIGRECVSHDYGAMRTCACQVLRMQYSLPL